jgi:hypothetical protein
MDWVKVGDVTHYFGKIDVAIVMLEEELAVGDWIALVWGGELVFEQEVTSMQIEYQNITAAGPGDDIGLQVVDKVKVGVEVYKQV